MTSLLLGKPFSRRKPSLGLTGAAGFKLPSRRLAFTAGFWGALGGGEKVFGGISAAGTGAGGQRRWAATCSSAARRAGGAGGGLCVPPNQDPRCLCWSALGGGRGCPCPRRAVTMLVASVLEKRTNQAAGAEPAVGGRGKLRHGDALSLTKHLT